MLLSFYSVVAGWIVRYAYLSATGALRGASIDEMQQTFAAIFTDATMSIVGAIGFVALTALVVMQGVQRGLERWSRILMPGLFVMLVALVARASALDGMGPAIRFLFSVDASQLTASGVLEALGHAFFTLSVGLGGMLTYASYLPAQTNLAANAVAVAVLDTAAALLACLVLFPIAFTYGLPPTEGPGLVFVSLPIAFARMPGGDIVATVFFLLLLCAALTSSISMLELAVSYFIDERGWSRRGATWRVGSVIAVMAIPSALAGSSYWFGPGLIAVVGKDWFTLVADTVTNWLTPLGGLSFAIFVGWRLSDAFRRDQFGRVGRHARGYGVWLFVLRYVAPAAIIVVFLHSVGLI